MTERRNSRSGSGSRSGSVSRDNEPVSGASLRDWERVRTIRSGGDSRRFPKREMTDTGNGARIRDYYRDQMQWVKEEKTWFVYDEKTGIWVDDVDSAMGLARTAMEKMGKREDRGEMEEKEMKAWRTFLKSSQSQSKVSDALRSAKNRQGMSLRGRGDFDVREELLCCKNGVLNLERMDLIPFDPALRLTRSTRVRFRPGFSCRLWDDYLDKFLPDEEKYNYIHKLAGYTLLPGNRERLFVIAYAPNSSGKSMFRTAMLNALGDYGWPAPLSLLRAEQTPGKPNPAVIKAEPARFVTAVEANSAWRLHADVVKQLTGGDSTSARGLYSGDKVVRPLYVVWIFTNGIPTIEGRDSALDRRIVGFKFDVEVPPGQEDTTIADDMDRSEEVREAVLAWLVDGLYWYKIERLPKSAAVLENTQEVLSQLSELSAFLDECCEVGQKFHDQSSDLFYAYEMWCETNRSKERLTSNKFQRELTNLGFGKRRVRVGGRIERHRIGIRRIEK